MVSLSYVAKLGRFVVVVFTNNGVYHQRLMVYDLLSGEIIYLLVFCLSDLKSATGIQLWLLPTIF